jgi:hypothetical protein
MQQVWPYDTPQRCGIRVSLPELPQAGSRCDNAIFRQTNYLRFTYAEKLLHGGSIATHVVAARGFAGLRGKGQAGEEGASLT